MLLKFSSGNRKIKKLGTYLGKVSFSFDLPAGHTCPAANLCLSMANPESGKITDGPNCEFRCYAASLETVFTSTRRLRWHNYNLLKGLDADDMVTLIGASIPLDAQVIRIHSSGDFFNRRYFQAWVKVAQLNPQIDFFGYTKILPYVSEPKSDNFTLVYSYGGKMDALLTNEPYARVVQNLQEAIDLGLPVSCVDNPVDDYDFIKAKLSFALPIHGVQPKRKR